MFRLKFNDYRKLLGSKLIRSRVLDKYLGSAKLSSKIEMKI
jgi:hypothetical protein